MSGTALCVWALAPDKEGIENSKKLAESFDCSTESTKNMVECLRQVDAMEIVKHDVFFMEWDFDPMIPFKPTIEPKVEGAFLTEHPIDIVKAGKSAPIPLIVGITTEDGALRGAAVLNNEDLLDELSDKFDILLPISLMYDKTSTNVDTVTKKIKNFYFNNEKIDVRKKRELINMYTDGWFLSCADKTVQLHTNYTKQPVYYYLFGHRGEASFTKIFGGGDVDYGVCHADDLQYLFPVGDGLFPDKKPTPDDKYVAKLFTSLFANFAHTGDPTPDHSDSDIIPEKWQRVEANQMQYYRIDAKSPGMRQGLFLERAKFWRELQSNSQLIQCSRLKNEL